MTENIEQRAEQQDEDLALLVLAEKAGISRQLIVVPEVQKYLRCFGRVVDLTSQLESLSDGGDDYVPAEGIAERCDNTYHIFQAAYNLLRKPLSHEDHEGREEYIRESLDKAVSGIGLKVLSREEIEREKRRYAKLNEKYKKALSKLKERK